MAKRFILPEREEPQEVYEAAKAQNQKIAIEYKNSIVKLNSLDVPMVRVDYDPSQMVIVSEKNTNFPFGDSTTFGKSGGCPACIHDALIYTNPNFAGLTLIEVMNEIARKGYYKPGIGTCHNVFEHFKLPTRAKNIEQVLKALATRRRAIVTMLVRNKTYNGQEGRHFINVLYYRKLGNILTSMFFIVNDNLIGNGISIPASKILNSTEIAWIWPSEL